MSIRVIVCGYRYFNDYALAESVLMKILAPVLPDVEIVSGHCIYGGADSCGELFASRHGVPCKLFPADWSIGRSAGPIRNQKMLEYAVASSYPVVIAFSNGSSRGTADMIRRSISAHAHVCVVSIASSDYGQFHWVS